MDWEPSYRSSPIEKCDSNGYGDSILNLLEQIAPSQDDGRRSNQSVLFSTSCSQNTNTSESWLGDVQNESTSLLTKRKLPAVTAPLSDEELRYAASSSSLSSLLSQNRTSHTAQYVQLSKEITTTREQTNEAFEQSQQDIEMELCRLEYHMKKLHLSEREERRKLKTEHILEQLEKKEPERIIDASEEAEIDALFDLDPSETVVKAFKMSIHAGKLHTLAPGTWLNDEVINFYASLVLETSKELLGQGKQWPKIHVFNSFFYTKLTEPSYNYNNVRRWSKRAKVEIASLDKVIVPVNVGNTHWVCVIINIRDKQFEFFDSLSGRSEEFLKNLRYYLRDEIKHYTGQDWDLSTWQNLKMSCPQQQNGYDCGVFTCRWMLHGGFDIPFNFSQDDMSYFRKRMMLEIKHARLHKGNLPM